MRILKRAFRKNGGFIVLLPTTDEDLWHAYNLINVGDYFKMSTFRKVISSTATGAKNVEKKRMTITIAVKDVEYFARGEFLTIEIRGRSVAENDYLHVGQFHSFALETDVPFTLYKSSWEKYHRSVIREIEDEGCDAEVGAVVMDIGIAYVCYIKTFMTLVKAKIERNVPRKGAASAHAERLTNKFYEEVFKALMSLNLDSLKCVIIGSPGYVKEYFLDYVKQQLQAEGQKDKHRLLEKVLLVHTNTGFKSSLVEALQDEAVKSRLKDTKAMRQTKVLDQFYKMLTKNSARVAYGDRDVSRCFNERAIKTLLISDMLLRTKDLKKRRQYSEFVDLVRQSGGEAFVFSSLHPSGERLNSISGIAAILKFDVTFDEEMEDMDAAQEQRKEQAEEKQEVDPEAMQDLVHDGYEQFM